MTKGARGRRVHGGGPRRVGRPCAYALTRPPGHHATRSAYGGSCYLNNAAIAAQALRDAGFGRSRSSTSTPITATAPRRSSTSGRRLHGFRARRSRRGLVSHHVGFADETGRDAGFGANLNVPLAPGSGDEAWLSAVERAVDAAGDFGATALVIALGVDAAIDDPESPLQVTVEGYRRAGRLLARTGTSHRRGAGGWLPPTDTGPAGRFGARRARVWLA